MVSDAESGPRLDLPLAETEVCVVDVHRMAAVAADDVVMVRTFGPLEAAALGLVYRIATDILPEYDAVEKSVPAKTKALAITSLAVWAVLIAAGRFALCQFPPSADIPPCRPWAATRQ